MEDIRKTLDSIPIELLDEIFSRLPAKSVGRCRCVSKIWASRLGSDDFKQLFLTRSLSRPRLLFVSREYPDWEWVFYSSLQPQNPYDEKSSLVLTADFRTKLRRSFRSQLTEIIYVSGLCYLSEVCEGEKDPLEDTPRVNVICNLSTRQYLVLPKLGTTERRPTSCFGFDPIDKQFKVLLMNSTLDNNHILTLGSTGKLRWRRIQCPLLITCYPYQLESKGICINGILYFLAQRRGTPTTSCVIVCFDVRSETFMSRLIDVEQCLYYKLKNYKGKLCMISKRDIGDESTGIDIELQMCVLEDVEKQEWSKYVYTLPKTKDFRSCIAISVVGITATNEIVLVRVSTISFRPQPFCVYYFNPQKNTLQGVPVIQGFEGHGELRVFMDHVEDLHVNDAKQFKPNLPHKRPKKFRSINEITYGNNNTNQG